MTEDQKRLWIGIGIGFAAGGLICGTTVGLVTRNSERKKAEDRVRKQSRMAYLDGERIGYSKGYQSGVHDSINGGKQAVKIAYDQGVDDATLEAQKWMDSHLIQVDSDDPEAIKQAIEKASQIVSEEKKGEKSPIDDENRLSESDYEVKNSQNGVKTVDDTSVEAIFGKTGKEPNRFAPQNLSGRRYMIQHAQSGTTIEYPIELFCDSNGFLSPSQMRINIRDYEKDPNKLRMVWEAMGWGTYIPDMYAAPSDDGSSSQGFGTEDGIPPIEVINNWDVSIDDVNKMLEDAKNDPESEERTIEFERYMDKVEKYRNNPTVGIKFITEQEYREESHLDHIEIDYYDVDNVFLQPDSNDRQLEDPITDLGVSDGKFLFDHVRPGEDPDVVYVENFAQHFVAEITRYHKSSTGIMDGSAYLNGETGVVGGTTGV